MIVNRRTALAAPLALSLGGRVLAQSGAPEAPGTAPIAGLPGPDQIIALWPKGAPGMPVRPPVEQVVERSTDAALNDRAVMGITRPRLAVFRPLTPNGAAVMITPGGGYKWVVVDKEGYELGRWLAARGFTVFVLFYRLPGDGWAAGPNVALSDAQRAMRVIRSRAREFAIEPERVAAMGFSAGGHVCTDLIARFAHNTYAPVDDADALSPRPYLGAPIYPVQSMHLPVAHPGSRELLIGKDAGAALESAHSPAENVAADSPPCFLVHAEDDDVVPVDNTLQFRAALKAKGIAVETHLFTNGGHGFGIRRVVGKPAGVWPELFVNWARTQGFW